MNTLSFDIPIHYLRQFLFCARIPYLLEVEKVRFQAPLWLQQGEREHVRQEYLMRRRSLRRFGLEQAQVLGQQSLCSEKYKLHGIVDAVLLAEDQVYPIEYKLGTRPSFGHIMQLCAYGLLAQEHWQRPCRLGFILQGKMGKTFVVKLEPQRIEQLKGLCEKLRESLATTLPESSASMAQCSQCEFINYCNDRE